MPYLRGEALDGVYNGVQIVAEDISAIVDGNEPAHHIE